MVRNSAMEQGVIVLVSDRPDRSRAVAEAISKVAECRVIGTKEAMGNISGVGGIIADVTLSRPEAKSCLRQLVGARRRKRTPLLYLTRSNVEASVAEARSLGATLCLSAYSEPRLVVQTLMQHIWPDKTIADLVVSRGSAVAGSLMSGLFEVAAQGRLVDMSHVERSVDPVLDAIEEGGLSRWLYEVWTHDDITFQHCLLVSGIAASFAQNLKLSKQDQDLLTRAALVHDLGKARIPVPILNKPGPLDEAEMAVMRTHAAIGYDILKASGGCDAVTLDIVRHHHEMLDGSGYPDGLKGAEISDPVRLLTICDIYAALVERRAYKEPMPTAEALRILAGMQGKLEVGLVKAFAGAVRGVP